VILAGGGTGGHVYPGLSVARALQSAQRERGGDLDLLYVGIRGRVDERIVPADGIAFEPIAAGALRVSSPLRFAGNLARLAWGILQSIRIMRRFRPDAVFATGGYASVPVGVAARALRRPLVVYLPDVTPGWAVRLLSRLATHMTTTSERALAYLPAARTTVVGYPVRDTFWLLDRPAARQRLGIPADEKLLVITAGSLGARAINEAIWRDLPALLNAARVLHITGAEGERAAMEQKAQLAPQRQARYDVRGYLDDMPAALIAADLVVARAGASTLGELPAAGAPGVLIPGEYEGWSQVPNAEFLQEEGAAVMLRNDALDRLGRTVIDLLADDTRLAAMRAATRRLARPDAARDLARVVMEAAE
jgi:UDP-N-acetylglucosamine--N-acetylmuramyl-(pentapeptide) pyrophosphoryl-undecaprenol N-acetylglucosamine transferase